MIIYELCINEHIQSLSWIHVLLFHIVISIIIIVIIIIVIIHSHASGKWKTDGTTRQRGLIYFINTNVIKSMSNCLCACVCVPTQTAVGNPLIIYVYN